MADYTTIDDLDLNAIVAHYGLHDLRLGPLGGGAANSSFHLTAAEGEYTLTVLDNHDLASAQQLASHTQLLHTRGLPTTEVIPNRRGDTISVINDRPVLLKRWIKGDVLNPLPDHLLPAAGALLAQLHNLSADLPGLPVGTRRLTAEQEAHIIKFEDKQFAAWLTEKLDFIKQNEVRDRDLVICHDDLFADNIICRPDNTLAVIDWETVSLDDPLLDLGMAVVDLARHHNKLPLTRVQHLFNGYAKIRPLTPDDLQEVTTQITHVSLIIAFHRYCHHNIRFPNPLKANIHKEIVSFVDSLPLIEPAMFAS